MHAHMRLVAFIPHIRCCVKYTTVRQFLFSEVNPAFRVGSRRAPIANPIARHLLVGVLQLAAPRGMMIQYTDRWGPNTPLVARHRFGPSYYRTYFNQWNTTNENLVLECHACALRLFACPLRSKYKTTGKRRLHRYS